MSSTSTMTAESPEAQWEYNGQIFRLGGENAIPFSSTFRMAKGYFGHMVGNQVASKVVGWIRKELGHSKENQVSKEAVVAYRAANTDKVAAQELVFENEFIEAIRAGTLLDRAIVTREPARSPVDNLALAKMRVAVEQAFVKLATARKQLGQEFTWKSADLTAKVKEMAANAPVWAKYKALAEAELAAASEDEIDLGQMAA